MRLFKTKKMKTIKSWSPEDRPREKLRARGPLQLTDSELIAILIQIGGFGIVGFATLLGYLVEGRVSLAARLSATAETGAANNPEIRKVIFGILKMMALFEFIVFAFLFFRFLGAYNYSLTDALGHGAFHAISSFNNAGFGLYSDNLMQFATDGWILLPIAFSVLFGALGFPVLSEVWDRLKVRLGSKKVPRLSPQWSLNTRITLWGSLVLLLVGVLLIGFLEWNNPNTFGPFSILDKIINTFFASVMPPMMQRSARMKSTRSSSINWRTSHLEA